VDIVTANFTNEPAESLVILKNLGRVAGKN
jgi:hypothetical protein